MPADTRSRAAWQVIVGQAHQFPSSAVSAERTEGQRSVVWGSCSYQHCERIAGALLCSCCQYRECWAANDAFAPPSLQLQGHVKKDLGYVSGALYLAFAGVSLHQGLKD